MNVLASVRLSAGICNRGACVCRARSRCCASGAAWLGAGHHQCCLHDQEWWQVVRVHFVRAWGVLVMANAWPASRSRVCSVMCPQLVWIEHYPRRRQLVCCHPDDLHLLCCVRGLALRGRSVSRSRFGVAHEFGRVCSAIYIPLTFVPSMTVRHTAICMAICMCVARALSHVPGSRLPTAGVQGRPRFGRRLCPRGCQDREPSRCRCSPGQRRVTLDVCPIGACGTVVAVGSPVCCKPHSTSAVPDCTSCFRCTNNATPISP